MNINYPNYKGLIAVLGLTVLVLVIVFLNQNYTLYYLKAEAIEKGYALHCPKDGEFAWKGECDD